MAVEGIITTPGLYWTSAVILLKGCTSCLKCVNNRLKLQHPCLRNIQTYQRALKTSIAGLLVCFFLSFMDLFIFHLPFTRSSFMDSKNPRKLRYKNLCKIYKWQKKLGEPADDHLQLPSANFFYKSANTWWLSSSSFSKNDWSSTRWAEDLPASASTDTGVDETHTWPSHSWSRLVFAGPVLWTVKRPQLDQMRRWRS